MRYFHRYPLLYPKYKIIGSHAKNASTSLSRHKENHAEVLACFKNTS